MFRKLHFTSYKYTWHVAAIAEVYKNDGNEEYKKKNFYGAIYFYTEGIGVNCKDKELNAKLYSNRAAAHLHLGEKFLLFVIDDLCPNSHQLNMFN